MCSLADVYCDIALPDMALAIFLTPEIEAEKKITTPKKATRRLLVASMHVQPPTKFIPEYGKKPSRSSKAFSVNCPTFNVSDQLLHEHALVAAAARTSHCNFPVR